MESPQRYSVRYVHVQSEEGRYVAHVGVKSAVAGTVDVPILIFSDNTYEVQYDSNGAAYLCNPETLAEALGLEALKTDEPGRSAEIMALLTRAGVFLAIRVELAHLSELYAAAGYRDFVPVLAAA